MTQTRKKVVAAYLRVSSDEQRENQTIRTQEDAIRRYVEMAEVDVCDWYRDDGVSGTVPMAGRPQGRRLLADAARGCFSEVLVFKIDRLGRDDLDPIVVWKELERLHVGVRSVIEGVSTIFEYHIRVAMSAEERRAFLARSKAGMERAAREGRYTGGIRPFGYDVEGKKQTARLVPSEEPFFGEWSEAALVRQMYVWVGLEGWSTVRVADHLNSVGVRTSYVRDGRPVAERKGTRKRRTEGIWRPGRIRNLLINPVYKGELQYGRRSKYEREIVSAPCVALVEPELWQAAQRQLRTNRLIAKRGNRVNLLRSLMVCNCCGLTYGVMLGGDRVPYYRCGGQSKYRSKTKGGVGPCAGKYIRVDFIETIVVEDVKNFLVNPGSIVEELKAEQVETPASLAIEAERSLVESALSRIPAERDRLLEMRMHDLITFDEVAAKLDALRDGEQRLRDRLTVLHPAQEPEEELIEEDLVWEIRRRVEELDAYSWQEVLSILVKRIDVHTELRQGKKHATITIHYRFPGVPPISTDRGSSPRRA